eukprot:g31293.t1
MVESVICHVMTLQIVLEYKSTADSPMHLMDVSTKLLDLMKSVPFSMVLVLINTMRDILNVKMGCRLHKDCTVDIVTNSVMDRCICGRQI